MNLRHSLRALAASALVAATALAASAQTIRDTEIEETLDVYTTPILRAAGLDPDAVDIYIVNDPALNAFVTRGQNIFLHTGLILEADTANQLKGVIAHETGHIADGRIARSDYENRSAYGKMLVAAGVGLAAILAGEGGAGAAILSGAPQFGTIEVLSHTRTGESVADQYAATYMERTRQSGEGLIEFFEKFRAQEVLSSSRRYPYFRSHPLSSDRIEKLRERVAESEYRDAEEPGTDAERMRMMQAKLFGFLAAPQRVFTRYPLEDQSVEARYARSVAYFQNAELKLALGEVDSLIADDPDNPYYHELRAQFLFESGRGDDSIPSIERALELKPDAPLFKLAYAQALIGRGESGDTDEAVRQLKSALVTERDNAAAWYYLSLAHSAQGRDDLAEYAVAEQAFSVGDFLRAKQFAERAKEDLPRGEPSWRRAADIVAVAEVQLARKNKDRRGPKPFTALR